MADLLMGRRDCCEWNPQMPVPAGTGVDRRRFLLGAAGGLLSVYGADRLGLTSRMLGDGIAEAASGPAAPVLVSVFLAGGIDALSVLAPVGDPQYRKLRPTLAVAPSAGTPFGEDPRLHWHPAAGSLAKLHDAGKLTVFPGIGYTSPDMSHFTSRHYWEVGVTETRVVTGWLGRYLDTVGSATNPLQGLSMDGEMNPTLATARNPVAAIQKPEDFSLWLEGVWGDAFGWSLDAAAALGNAQRGSRDPAIAQVAEAASEVGVIRHALAPFRDKNGGASYRSPVAYPKSADSDFPGRLAGLAAMIAAGLPLRCVALTADGQFDTHSSQAGAFNSGLSLVGDSLAAFQADLEARGIADRVLVHVWSEFGRRAAENGSAGTDHGAAGVSMLIGTRASGKMIGESPGLTRLDADGNLRENVDFRGVYCSLLEQWFGHDAGSVIPGAGGFRRYQVIR
ncbi:MAG: DUF1501 domain-containing protein [Solirubrobacteraceae bacterium]